MFLLSYNTFSEGIFNNTPSLLSNFSKLSFFGECKVDGIHLMNYEMTDEELKNQTTEPVYGIDTILAANFENTLECGSLVLYVGGFPTKYIIRKKISDVVTNDIFTTSDGEFFIADGKVFYSSDTTVFEYQLNTKIAEVDVSVTEYIDYTPKNNTNYTYTLSPFYDDGQGVLIEGRGLEGSGEVSFTGWILSDTSATPVVQYVFDIEVESDDFKVNKDYKMFQNYTKYPSFRFGASEYLSSGLKTIPYSYDDLTDNYNFTEDNLQEIVDFINNGNEKILRTPSGKVIKVVTTDASYKYMDKTIEQISTLSFNFFESGAV